MERDGFSPLGPYDLIVDGALTRYWDFALAHHHATEVEANGKPFELVMHPYGVTLTKIRIRG